MPVKRIGYVDLELENFHANVYLKILRNELKSRGFEVTGCTALNEETGKAWAAKNNVPYFSSVAALNDNVDYYIVLAPGTPDIHETLCKSVFPFGKTTYVDKTFAPDLKTAKRIFALADKHKVPMQTSSALRYTAVQKHAQTLGQAGVRHMVAWGGGRSFGEYAIHPTELVVSCMGPEVVSLMRRGAGKDSQLLLNFSQDRTAVINVYTEANTPFAASVSSAAETKHIPVDGSTLFIDMATAILDLFENGKPSIDRMETLAIRRILDAADKPAALKKFIKV